MPAQGLFVRTEFAFLAAIVCVYCFANLAGGSLRDWDEAVYAEVAANYFRSGDWSTPMWNGELWFHKPPLVMWFSAAGYPWFGIGELAPRLASALSASAGVLCLYALTRPMLGRRVALLASLVFLSTPIFLIAAKNGMVDPSLTLFISLSLLFYWRGLAEPRWFLAAGAAFGLAFMTKGMASGLAPAAALVHLFLHRRFEVFRSPYLWLGALLALAILAPWHVLQHVRFGQEFWNEYIGFHVMERLTEGIEGHSESVFYFLHSVTTEQRPWFLLSFVAFPYCAYIAWREGDARISLFVCWVGTMFVIASSSVTKLDQYILPIYPALAVCIAFMCVRVVPSRHFAKMVGGALVVLMVQPIVQPQVFRPDYSPEVKALGTAIQETVSPGHSLFVYNRSIPAPVFYGRRHVVHFTRDKYAKLSRVLAEQDEAVVLLRDRDFEELSGLVEGEAEPFASSGEHQLVRVRRSQIRRSRAVESPGRDPRTEVATE